MKTLIKPLLGMAIAILAFPCGSKAQTFYQENETAISIFRKLNEMFPKRYLTQRQMAWAQYWVQYWYEDPDDYLTHKEQVSALFNELDRSHFLHKNIDMTDSAGVQRSKYIMTFPSDIRGQQDYLTLTADNTGIWFYYQATNRFSDLKSDGIPDQAIVKELEQLFDSYVSRKKVRKEEVSFQGSYKRVVHSQGSPKDPTAFSKGFKYVVPHCTKADYQLFYDLFHKYLKKDMLYVASNDVYWNFEEVGIRIRLADGRPLYMGAALIGDDLHLIRTVGSYNGNGVLPRAWALDDPVWDGSYISRKLQEEE